MDDNFSAAMARATTATRASNLSEATRIIREALGLQAASSVAPRAAAATEPGRRPRLDANAEVIEPADPTTPPDPARPGIGKLGRRLRRPLREVIRTLREGRHAAGLGTARPAGAAPLEPTIRPPVPEAARFEERRFACAEGARDYKLYMPARAPEKIQGLVVMLHGCKQDPDDFAVGTNMNAVAEASGLIVVYPRQTATDNLSSCWNWFRPGDQRREGGEPAILAGITRAVVAEFAVDPSRVYIAGLSAGGAMAAVMAEAYPEIYAAVGIHSGLPAGAANDVMSAFAAMRGDPGLGGAADATTPGAKARTIVFHGTADRTVSPSNAARILAARPGETRRQAGQSGAGRGYTRTLVAGPDGAPETEVWLVEDAGHAWSGGQAAGSFTDPAGPDASAEMVRFFLDAA